MATTVPPGNYNDPTAIPPVPDLFKTGTWMGRDWQNQQVLPKSYPPATSMPGLAQNGASGNDPYAYMMQRYPYYAELMRTQSGLGGQLAEAGVGAYTGLAAASPAASNMSYGTLLQILMGQGRTDPRLMNSQMAQIQQNTQGAQMQQQGMAARQGFGNSGVNAALQAGLANAGNARQSDVMAREAQLTEERKRSDLDLFMKMIQGPSEAGYAMSMGQYAGDKDRAQQEKAAQYAAIASLVGGVAGAFCWVADAVLDDKMAVDRCRLWMRLYADETTYGMYEKHGQGLAEVARNNEELANELRPIFLAMDENVMLRLAEDGWFGVEA